MHGQDIRGRVGFVVGTGRCGTRFFAELAALEQDVAASHERNAYNESFHRYCKWYGLQVDSEGFLSTKQAEIINDLGKKKFSLEASGYLSFSIEELYERFTAKFLLLIRRPDKVINSFIHKGWYQEPYICSDHNLAPGYQEPEAEWFNHFLARVAPRGEEFPRWNGLSRVGKLAWYWNAVNQSIFEQFDKMPPANSKVVKLEELDYGKYREVAEFFGYESLIDEKQFNALAASRPNRIGPIQSAADWTDREYEEFVSQANQLAGKLSYPVDRELLMQGQAGPQSGGGRGIVRMLGGALVRILNFSARGSNYLARKLEKWTG